VTDEHPAPKPRSKRLHILWAIALTLLLTLGAFCWLVVVPVWRVQAATEAFLARGPGKSSISVTKNPGSPGQLFDNPLGPEDAAAMVKNLGGGEQALRSLRTYISCPRWIAPNKLHATQALMACGKQAEPYLETLQDMEGPENADIRTGATWAYVMMLEDQPAQEEPE
jgi:hypothetical protein